MGDFPHENIFQPFLLDICILYIVYVQCIFISRAYVTKLKIFCCSAVDSIFDD